MPARLNPIESPSPTVFLTGDPRRAFAIAGALMVQPRMSHQARGLWGYTGTTETGFELTVQSTGTGAPSAAMVLGDLALLGAKHVIRLGTCVSPKESHRSGEALVVDRAVGLDGVSTALAEEPLSLLPDPDLLHLISGVAPGGVISSHDLPPRMDPRGPRPAAGASARDLQTAAIFATARKRGLAAAAVVLVSGDGEGPGTAEAELNERLSAIGRVVLERLENQLPNSRVEG